MNDKILAFRRFAAKAASASVNYVKTTYIAMWGLILTCTIYGCMLIHSARPIAIKTQVMAAVLGFGGAFVISLMDYHRLGQLWPIVGGACIFLVGLTFVVGQSAIGGNAVADDVAWLNIFGYSFQPSELMKIGFIITFAYHLSYVLEKNTLNTVSSVFMLGGHALVPVGLCKLQGDDGTALMFMVIFLIMFFSSGLSWHFILLGLSGIVAMTPLLWQTMSSHQQKRFSAVYNPQEGDEMGILYQQTLGKVVLFAGSCYLFGKYLI